MRFGSTALATERVERRLAAILAADVAGWADVDVPDSAALRVRRDMERCFAPPSAALAAQ
jgi:hypothetical protein